MKKIIIFFLLIPYLSFSQENMVFDLFTEYSYFENEETIKPDDKLLKSLFPFTVLLGSVALNVGMREGIYRNNPENNWWGIVNGAFTLGLTGTIIGTGISYGIYKISNENFDKMNVLWGTFLGLAGGITMAFFPPFKQAFRENPYLYYTFPVLLGAGLTFVIVDIWVGKGNTSKRQKDNILVELNF
jgi:hypothetical protein